MTLANIDDFSAGKLARYAQKVAEIVGKEVALPFLFKLLEHPDLIVKEGAVYGLSSQMNEEIKLKLEEIITSDKVHPILREIVEEVLEDYRESLSE